MRTVTHTEHQKDFNAGYNAKQTEIREIGFDAARDKFNLENPKGQNPSSLGGYYYADGELQALSDAMK